MEEEVNKALADLLTMFVQGVEGAVEFGKQEVPEVVEQLLVFKTAEFTITLVTLFFLFLASVRLQYNLWQGYKKASADHERRMRDEEIPYMFGVIGGILPTSVFLIGFTKNVTPTLKVWLAPKVYLLEYAAQLIK